jgi:hypothetical protein
MRNGKENIIKDEKRLNIERRRFSYTYLIPERRNKNRGDRRKNSDGKQQKENYENTINIDR